MTPQPTQHVMRLRRMFHISHADVRTCSRGRKPGSACALPTTRTDSRHAATIIRKQVRTRSPLNSRPRTAKTAGNARQAAKTSAASIPTGPRSGNPVQSTPGQKKKKENVKWLHVALTLTQHVLCAPVFRIERSNITFSLLYKEWGQPMLQVSAVTPTAKYHSHSVKAQAEYHSAQAQASTTTPIYVQLEYPNNTTMT